MSVEAGMHVSVEAGLSTKEQAAIEHAINLRDEVFAGRPSMRYSELETAIRNGAKTSDGGAKRIFRKWGQLQIIQKGPAGLWTPTL